MTETTVLSRRQLYDLVWATPLSKLALRFGVSDRGLAKICERHRVPTPPRGYWARLAAGGRPKQAAFVEMQGESPGAVRIDATLSNIPDEAREILARAKQERKTEKADKEKRREFLGGVLSNDREAEEISNWLSKIVTGDPKPDEVDFARFVGWAEALLDRLKQAGSAESIQNRLREEKLFPEIDELNDPLGEPPRGYYYGGNDDH